jgi:enoyl-CoA hydratase/carnithine racemase
MGNESNIIFEVQGGVGWITLNRPKALNALSLEMVEQMGIQLREWADDARVAIVCIQGAGDKGLCAGGDMRAYYDRKDSNAAELAYQFFSIEYRLNWDMFGYPKPILVYLNGIVMGGGVGISIGASHRIVTERTKWAMPEMNIGFFPDVGGSYFLNEMPGQSGLYLALTSDMISPGDVLHVGAADYFVPSDRWGELIQSVRESEWTEASAKTQLTELCNRFAEERPESALKGVQEKIDQHFAYDQMEQVMDSLKQAANEGDEWAAKTAETLSGKSPTALKVALEQIRRGKSMSLAECFKMEMNMGMQFMRAHDFYEGVRAVLVDKDRSPKWKPASLEEVTKEEVNSFFDYEWGKQGNPLDDLK